MQQLKCWKPQLEAMGHPKERARSEKQAIVLIPPEPMKVTSSSLVDHPVKSRCPVIRLIFPRNQIKLKMGDQDLLAKLSALEYSKLISD